MHSDSHVRLKSLTRHQQPIDVQLCQLTNDMNRLLSLSSFDDHDTEKKLLDHPQNTVHDQYILAKKQIDLWETTMTKRVNDVVSHARQTLRNSYEQLCFEIEEWSTERQVELQQLAADIEQLSTETHDNSEIRMKIDKYNRLIQKYTKENELAHVELNIINFELIPLSLSSIQLFHLFEHSMNFDLSLIRDPPHACFDASISLASSILTQSSSWALSNSVSNRREKIFLPSILISSKYRIILFSNKTKQLTIFSNNGALIDQFKWDHDDIVDICYDPHSSTVNDDDSFYVLAANGSVYSLEYHAHQHSYSWLQMIVVNYQTYYTQLICDSKSSYLYLLISSKHRLDQWSINRSKRNIVHRSNQLIITNDHVEHLCASDHQLALLLRDKKKIVNYRIEIRNFTDLLVTIRSIKLDQLSRPLRLVYDNRHGFILAYSNQLYSFSSDGEKIISQRTFDGINEIRRVAFCQRSTCAILTERDQLLFYILSK